jgi:hypothetical protein|tara:strand:- start:721 stop:942 length:222 start_codon:yes stop_codon:yes gene_type:complete
MELIQMIMLVFAFYGLLFIMPLIGARLSARTTQVKEGYSGVSTPTIGIIVAVLLVALLIGLNASGERLMASRS